MRSGFQRYLSRLSIEWKLPIAISILLFAVLAVTSWLTYHEVARSARESAERRVENASRELAGSMQQEMAASIRRLRSVASQAAIRAYLAAPNGRTERAAREAMRVTMSLPNFAGVDLRDAKGRPLVSLGNHSADIAAISPDSLLAELTSDSGSVGRIRVLRDTAVLPRIAPISGERGTLGYLVHWTWAITTPADNDRVVRLMGPDAIGLVFGQDSVWTTGARLIRVPELADTHSLVRYERDGVARMAGISPVRGALWRVGVEYSEQLALAPARRVVQRITLPALVVLLLGLLGAWLTSRRITTPLRQLTAAARTMSGGDFSARVELKQEDELGQLGSAFNEMAEHVQQSHRLLESNMKELQQTQEQFVQAQRMEAVGQLAGGVAHDFNNLLSVIIGETDLALMTGEVNPQLQASFASIRQAGDQAAGLTKQLLAFSRKQLVQPTVFQLNDLVLDASKMLRRLIGEDIELITRTSAGDSSVLADRGQIEQVIMNLVVNARDAMPDGGKLVLETRSATLDEHYAESRPEVKPGEYVMVSVSDTGTGMSETVQSHVFEPFFTTKGVGRGTGLGLATCFGIVKQTGGHIAVYSEVGVGTTVKVYLPRARETAPRVEPAKAQLPSGSEAILITEDDESVRNVATRLLRAQGYQVMQAASAGEAIRILSASEIPIDLLLTDVVMPHMGGRELAERAQQARPGIKVLFASGYTDDVILQHRLIAHDVVLVQKPFTAETLGSKVREVLDAPVRSLV